jgi:hypothetical protein
MNMKTRLIGSAALALGVISAVPSFASADWRDRDYRDRGGYYERYDRGYYDRDFDVDVPLSRVPHEVLRTVRHEARGRRIEAVQYVRRDGKLFYRVRVDDPGWRDRDVNIRVQPGGRLLSIEEAERWDRGHYGPGWRR